MDALRRYMFSGIVIASVAGLAATTAVAQEGGMDMNTKTELATFAEGCFWGVQALFDDVAGVVKTTAGYTGGNLDNPTYEDVSFHTTGHAESVQVEFDPAKVAYGKLLDVFWGSHDPTTLNRQGPDVGSQYRSAIFYHNDEQKKEAEASKLALQESGKFKRPIVTEIAKAGKFYPAEEYHQEYFSKRGLKATCHIPSVSK